MSDHSPSNACPKCGAALPSAATSGLCPRCLMAEAMLPTQADSASASGAKNLTPEQLAPHFPQLEILECLGRGGMGVVYKARQRTLNRLVALKLLAPERVADEKFAQRFTHEAQALAALNHPGIVTIYDFGQAGGFYYLLMEFVDGVNLRQAMKAGRFTPEQALAVVPPVCEALQYAHEHGIVHRDIKPENLLLDKEGRVKIADFGIAKILGASAPDGSGETDPGTAGTSVSSALHEPTLASVAGTPQYMAPEQKAHRATDHRADIYSLGVVLYELLTGELPADKLQPPSSKVQIDVRLDEIVLRALEKSPELRYQTAGQFRTQVVTMTGRPPENAVPAAAVNTPGAAEAAEVYDGLSLIAWAWKSVPLIAVLLVFFNPWGERAWYYFAAGCSILAVLPAFGIGRRKRKLRLNAIEPSAKRAADFVSAGNPDARFSVTAIVGAAWIPFAFAAAAFWISVGVPFSKFNLGASLAIFASLSGIFGSTVLGWVAVSQIRRSAQRLHGMWLAVFDGLFFPLLALDLLIAGIPIFFWKSAISQNRDLLFTSGYPPDFSDTPLRRKFLLLSLIVLGLALIAWIDFLILRKVWRAVNKPVDGVPADSRSQPSGRKGEAGFGRWLRKFFLVQAPIAIVVALIVRTFFLQPFTAATDAAAPEIPRGSHVLVWKLARTFAAGDLIAYISGGRVNLGRVADIRDNVLVVNRNGEDLAFTPRADVIGKVLSVYWRATPPAVQAQERSRTPKSVHIIRNAGTVLVHHDGVDLHYVLFAAKAAGSSVLDQYNTDSLAWRDHGTFKLTEQQTFGYDRESTDPFHLQINGKEYDLHRGRVLVPHDDGTVEQLKLFPPIATAINPEELAKLIVPAHTMNEEPITVGKLRQQLEATEAQLHDALKTCAPTHPLVIEVRASIESLNQKIAEQTQRHGLEGATRAILEAELEQARAVAARQEAYFRAGATDGLELQTAKDKVEILEAQLTGDAVQVAKVRLVAARRQLELVSSRRKAGLISPAEYENAKGAVPIAEAKLREAEAKAGMARPSFGPVIEREVDGAIDFDAGKVTALPEKFGESNDIAVNVLSAISWMEHGGMDAVTEPSESLKGVGMKAKAVDKDAWDRLTPDQIVSMLEPVRRETWQDLDPNRKTDEERKTPATWVFETREGGKGILQVLEFNRREHGVKVRYKLVQGGATKTAATAFEQSPLRNPHLQFRFVADGSDTDSETLSSHDGKQQFRLRREVLLDDAAIVGAKVSGTGTDTTIWVTFSDAGGRRFAEITGANVGKQLAIVFDGKVLSAPTVRSAITGGLAQIAGYFAAGEAEAMANVLAPSRMVSSPAVLLPESAKGWRERFDDAYRLRDGELVRHIRPPFIPERLDYYRTDVSYQARVIPEPPNYFTLKQNDRGLQQCGLGFIGDDKHTLARVLRHVFGLKRYEIEGSAVLLDLSLDGDWTLREGADTEALLGALETVLRDETKRNIHFEKRTAEREVVVARGSIADDEKAKCVRIYAENTADTGAGGGSGEIGEFLSHVGDNLGIPFVNEVTDGGKTNISWENHADAHFTGMDSRLDELTAKVLDNIATQTGLSFTREKRRVEMWFVSEQQ